MPLSVGAVVGALQLTDNWTSTLQAAATAQAGFETKAKASFAGVTSSLESFGGTAFKAGTALSVGLSAPIALVGGMAIKLGLDAVESRNLIEVSFGGMTSAADAWAANLSKNFGLNRFETEKTAGVLFNMTSSMGLGKEAAFQMSTGVVELAADMASFRNIGMDEALTKIKSGLTGETEPLKAIGILVDELTVNTYAYTHGIAAQGDELSAQQKVLARYGAIMAQTKNDQGDLARTIESPANQLRLMTSRIEEAATAFGVALIPIVTQVVGVVGKLVPYVQTAVEWFAQLPAPVQVGAVALAAIVAAAGPVLVIVGSMATGVAAILPLLALMGIGGTAAAVGTTAVGVSAAAATSGVTALGIASAAATPPVASLSVATLGLSAAFWPIAAAIAAIWAAWEVGNIEAVKNQIAEWTLMLGGMSAADAHAAVVATAAAVAHQAGVGAIAAVAAETGKAVVVLASEAAAQRDTALATRGATTVTEGHATALKALTESALIANATANITSEAFAKQALAIKLTPEAAAIYIPALDKMIDSGRTLTQAESDYYRMVTTSTLNQEAARVALLATHGVRLSEIEALRAHGLSEQAIAERLGTSTTALGTYAAALLRVQTGDEALRQAQIAGSGNALAASQNAIDVGLAHELSALDQKAVGYTHERDTKIALADQAKAALLIDMQQVFAGSSVSLGQIQAKAEATYHAMAIESGKYSVQAILDAQRTALEASGAAQGLSKDIVAHSQEALAIVAQQRQADLTAALNGTLHYSDENLQILRDAATKAKDEARGWGDSVAEAAKNATAATGEFGASWGRGFTEVIAGTVTWRTAMSEASAAIDGDLSSNIKNVRTLAGEYLTAAEAKKNFDSGGSMTFDDTTTTGVQALTFWINQGLTAQQAGHAAALSLLVDIQTGAKIGTQMAQAYAASVLAMADAIARAAARTAAATAALGTLPHAASGITNFSGGSILVGERGPEVVQLPGGSTVIPSGATVIPGSRGASGSAPTVVHLTVGPGAVVQHYPIVRDRQAMDAIGQLMGDAVMQRLASRGVRFG